MSRALSLPHEHGGYLTIAGAAACGVALAHARAPALAERFSDHYFTMLAVASSLWLLGALVWGSGLLLMVRTRRNAEAT